MPQTDRRTAWHTRDVEQTLTLLDTDGASGLAATEAAERLALHGPNALPVADATPWWASLGRQFASPLIAILFVAGVITSVQRHWVDAGAIFLVLLVNASLGFWQERKAERDVRALQSLSTTTARVVRDGTTLTLSAEELVPGDVVTLESGDRVPADLRLIDANSLRINESMLTGESLAATKDTATADEQAPLGDRHGIAFSGTFVTSGRGTGVAVATGDATELGEISDLIQSTTTLTPLQLLTHSLERRIGLVVLAAVALMFVAGLVGGYGIEEMFRTAVALAVGAIPESLPIILTVAMSVGVSRMARRNAIVRTLPSVETLGSTTVIASDKTGTLTQNRLTVERLWTASGATTPEAEPNELVRAVLRAGALTNEATADAGGRWQGDAVDVAMLSAAVTAGAVAAGEWTAEPLAHTPYEPALRYSQTVRVDRDGRLVLYVKGSPDVLAAMSDRLATAGGSVPVDTDAIMAANDLMAADGLRIIATASRVLDAPPAERLDPPSGLMFLGLEGMTDPPREGVADAIASCHRAGIAVTMVTGDHPSTATAIAERLGLPSRGPALTGTEMRELDDAALARRLGETSVAARVTPQDKLRIVQVLTERGTPSP